MRPRTPLRFASLALGAIAAIATRAARGDDAVVHVTSNDPDVHLLVRTGAATVERHTRYGMYLTDEALYGAVCEPAPCDGTLPRGRRLLAARKPGGERIVARDPVTIEGPSSLHVAYTDRSAWRIAGGITFGASAVAGLAVLASSIHHEGPDGTRLDVGLTTIVIGGLVGLALVNAPDSVSFEVTPLAVGSLGRREGAASALPQGLALTLRF